MLLIEFLKEVLLFKSMQTNMIDSLRVGCGEVNDIKCFSELKLNTSRSSTEKAAILKFMIKLFQPLFV